MDKGKHHATKPTLPELIQQFLLFISQVDRCELG